MRLKTRTQDTVIFQQLEAAPPHAIHGLNEAFARDTTEAKINLTTGVYKDAGGTTPVLECVKEAERRLVETEASKGYLGIDGMQEFSAASRARSSGLVLHGDRLYSRPPRHLALRLLATPHPLRE